MALFLCVKFIHMCTLYHTEYNYIYSFIFPEYSIVFFFPLFIYIVYDRRVFSFSFSFSVAFFFSQTSDVEFLFGLDMLKRHLCVIDLRSGALALGSAGATVPFLSEKDLPSSARETQVIFNFYQQMKSWRALPYLHELKRLH